MSTDFRSQVTEEASSRYPQAFQDAEFDAFASGASWAWAAYATAAGIREAVKAELDACCEWLRTSDPGCAHPGWRKERAARLHRARSGRPATPPAPQAGEVEEVAQWLLSMRELAGEHNPEERRQFTRAATLLQRLAPPAYLVVGRPPEGFLDLLKSQPGEVQICSTGVSIEPLGDAARPTYLDAIRLAQGCHDYSGGHSGAEAEAWHGAIDTVVDVLKRAAVGPWDSQIRAVYGVGVEAQAGDVEELVPVSERLRVVKAGIRAGYMLGHHHTVEGSWGDPDEVADDIAQEILDDLPAPHVGEVEA